ncbi:MAG: hypothetical protein IJ325_00185 [Clostridia bacterium]|nr:hypothetical protein [Clostridia bacterium]
MMYTFKCNGVRTAVHTGNGTVFTLTPLAFDMLQALTPPLTDEIPMGLRYSFAKYDSTDLKNSYAEVHKVFEAMEEPDAAYDRLTAARVCADLENAETVFAGYAAKMGDADRFSLTVLADDTASAETVNNLIAAAKKYIPGVSVTVRCPLGSAAAGAEADEYHLLAGEMSAFDVSLFSALSANTAVSCTFSSGDDLSAFVKTAYDAGCRKLSLVPAANVSVNETMEMYDKLSRTLTRMYRTVKDFVFLPFAFSNVLPGKWIAADDSMPVYDMKTLPGYFGACGLVSHLAEDITDNAVLQKCVEYAIILKN